jgi:release factor glutamine methyltransferase
MTAATASVADAVRTATAALQSAGVPSPRVDAELLAAHVLGVRRGSIHLADWSSDQAEAFAALIERRAARVPLQHLTGTAPFRTIELAVGPGVFVPRPETETVLDAALANLVGSATVVDLCSGSGAIALSVACERTGMNVHAVEVDAVAVGWLRRNVSEHAEVLATGSRVHVHHAEVAEVAVGPLADLIGRVDLVISNPPYIPDGAIPRDPEAAEHDPALALFGGVDGMDVVRQVASQASRLLRPGGRVVIEHGEQQADEVQAILSAAGLSDVESGLDLAGRPRWSGGRR